ncbi:MAG: UbiA family prenyltransferase [Planctomycetales bacterium]|nr:UbiA family prenyltransferase [Planctomycetales bacterium]
MTCHGALAIGKLLRLPNVFTVVGNVTMAYLFVHQGLSPWWGYLCLLAASMLMYMAGMALNDVFDVEVDARERPQRPIPSGAIRLADATRIGWGLLLAGWLCGVLAGWLPGNASGMPWRSGLLATLLAGAIVLYDGVLKQTSAGPAVMGVCRFLNVLLGMSTGGYLATLSTWQPIGYSADQWMIAGGIGVYVMGITWFSRGEAGESDPRNLATGISLMLLGFVMLSEFPKLGAFAEGASELTMGEPWLWTLIIAMLAFTIVWVCYVALGDPTAKQVQLAVKQSILSLIVIDAAIVMATCTHFVWTLVVLMLLLPAMFLGRLMYST